MSASIIVNWSVFLVIGGSFFFYYNPQTLRKIWPHDHSHHHATKVDLPGNFPSEIQRKRKKRAADKTKSETTATDSDSTSAVRELRLSERSSESSRRPSSSRSAGSSRAIYTMLESTGSSRTLVITSSGSDANANTAKKPKIEQKLTKKQRQNQKKREEQKAMKAQFEAERQHKLRLHQRKLDSDLLKNMPRTRSDIQQAQLENPWVLGSKQDKDSSTILTEKRQLPENVIIPIVVERNESGDEEVWEDHKAFERIQQESDNGWQIVGKPKRK
ncbi:hypothetical protein NEOLI_001593 [Neolecta irregularis DAH-3]|uniref:Uncharacterized protein n=1 Tax=Neolecta irregularis (strain DAH-3) TaxID=1198029 RepID=A0A1U7LP05_NEOID|nr:hypothetical protein NEOLI_001593 [Neolecta irregularis DAH-3]|eukprot:OLL24396.1 hypothetical protein NEOLI_001593 [Neolecta irregularis DAH-3]